VDLWGAVSLVVAIVVAVPIVVLGVECLAAVLLGREPRDDSPASRSSASRPGAVILIPAHDEETEIGATLRSIGEQIGEEDRILVVAHNCQDRTGEISRDHGAEVVEARDDGQEGKPEAMRVGLDSLAYAPPEVVVSLDADCTVAPGSIDALVRGVQRTGGPVQGVYLFADPERRSVRQSVSRLALLIKNFVRPLGLSRLGLPCLINGSGVAFPYSLLRDVLRGESSIVEDRMFAIHLALEGYPTRFSSAAEVWSKLPESQSSAYHQRRRWEHGNLHLAFVAAPRLILAGIARARLGIIALGLDLLVPPLALLALVWGVTAALAGGVWFATGSTSPAWVAIGSGALLFVAILTACARFEGVGAAFRLLLGVPIYVAWKAPLYLAYAIRREKRWIRTARDGDPDEGRADERETTE